MADPRFPEGVTFVEPSTPDPAGLAVVPPGMAAPPLDSPLGALNAVLAEIRGRTADAGFAAQRADWEAAHETLAGIRANVEQAEQRLLALETPDVDLDSITVEAVRRAVLHRNRYTTATYKFAPLTDIYRALKGIYRDDGGYEIDPPPVDGRIEDDNTYDRLHSLVKRGLLVATNGRAVMYGVAPKS